MSEFLFGQCRGKVSAREAKRRTRICREEGGYGYSQYDESHGTAQPGGRWIGWFSGPNYGAPFDRDLERRVLARVDRKGEHHDEA
jgi:hypothetical protein